MVANTMKLATLKVSIVRDGNSTYSLDVRSPAKWKELRDADYGRNPETGDPFRMQTMPRAVRLANYGLTNRIQLVVQAVNRYWLSGNSLMLWTPRGLYAIDSPSQDIIAQLNVDNQKALQAIEQGLMARLGKKKKKGVVFSDAGDVRFTPLDKVRLGEQTASRLAKNPGNIVFSGSVENAELNAKTAELYRFKPTFYGVKDENRLTLRVPALVGNDGFDGRLIVYADGFGYYNGRYSFVAQETGLIQCKKF